jgi:histone-lysine N-methyltransferase MLL2
MLKLISALAFSAALLLGFAPPSSLSDLQELAQAEDEMMDAEGMMDEAPADDGMMEELPAEDEMMEELPAEDEMMDELPPDDDPMLESEAGDVGEEY